MKRKESITESIQSSFGHFAELWARQFKKSRNKELMKIMPFTVVKLLGFEQLFSYNKYSYL